MDWSFRSDLPIYSQLVERLMRSIVSGAYAPGERLPSVRELATQAGVNPNTMQRAFAELERLELVSSARTAGRFVTEDGARILRAREALARDEVTQFFKNMQSLGFSPAESRQLLQTVEWEDESK